jgi:5-methyltetrahydrofolate--homocysteine methyltransferase
MQNSVPEQFAGPLRKALMAGDRQGAVEATRHALDAAVEPLGLIQQVLVPTLTEIGGKFERMEVFLPELMAAGMAGSAVSEAVEGELAKHGDALKSEGTIVIGTVKGDIHDIGKNIVASLLRAHGYKVVDIGKDAAAKQFIEAAKREQAEVIAASALMSITRAGARDVVGLLDELGLRDQYLYIVGGGSIDQEYADEIGADGYSFTAAGAVELVSELLSERRAA